MKGVISLLMLGLLLLVSPGTQATGKVVCYYGSWSTYRSGEGKCDVSDLDPHLCTHLIYSFMGLDASTNKIVSLNPYLDLDDNGGRGNFRKFTNLRLQNPNLKTLVAIGGWNEGSTKYFAMASDPANRATFIKSVVDFLIQQNFNGLDLNWEYPSHRGVEAVDKTDYIILLKEMKEAFAPHGFLLTAALPAAQFASNADVNIPAITRYVDFVNIMTYDYHGNWVGFAGHNSPLYQHPLDYGNNVFLNINYTINFYINNGAPPSKLNLGLGSYGQSFTLANPDDHALYAPTNGPGRAGPLTNSPGTLGYSEICVKLQSEPWTVVRDQYIAAPYAYYGDQWIAYDDEESVTVKCNYAKSMGLGGVMVWSVETDDFRSLCGKKNPIISTMKEVMASDNIEPSPTTTTSGIPATVLKQCENNLYVRDPEDCSVFYQCIRGPDGKHTAQKYQCTAGLLFDTNSSTCNWASVVVC